MDKKVKKKKKSILNQHSALTTFKIKEGKYYKIGVEKTVFALLQRAQQDLKKKFRELFTDNLKKIGISKNKFDGILENAFTNKVDFNIEYTELNQEALTKVANETLKYWEKDILDRTGDKEEIKKLINNTQNNALTKVANSQKQLLLTPKDTDEIIGEIKRYCKDQTVKSYLDFKTINFTAVANFIKTNSTMLKKDIKQAANTVLEFNYINRKNLDVEIVSNLLASVRFTNDKKNNLTWMDYQIPREILELLLMPEVYVPLEGLVVSELTGSYTFRMYGFLKDHLKRGKVELSKEELFNFFSLPKSYANKTNLVKKFLKPTLEEVEKVSGIHVEYQFVPKNRYKKIEFYPVLKKEVKAQEMKVMPKENLNQNINDNLKISEEIKKSKKNIYVSKAWNKRTDNKINKLLREEGEEYTVFILKTLYRSLKDDIKTTLVQYINGIIKNQPKNEIIKETVKEDIIIVEAEIVEDKNNNAKEKPKEDPLVKVLLNWYDKMPQEEKEEIRKEAINKYLEATGTKKMTKIHQKIYNSTEKKYIIEVMKQIQGI